MLLPELFGQLWMMEERAAALYEAALLLPTRAGEVRRLEDEFGRRRDPAADAGHLFGLEAEGLGLVAGPHTISAAGVQALGGVLGQAQLGSVVVIPVFGMIQQHPSWASDWGVATSTDYVLRAMQLCMSDPQVGGIFLRFHSPGGAVNGVQVLADYIRTARKDKPIWGQADSLADSCAYWLLAQCSRAIATPMAEVGSIGCYVIHTSIVGADQQMGIKRTVIRAGANKADGLPCEDLSDDAAQRLQARVDSAYAEFSTGVSKGRGVSLTKVQGAAWGEGAAMDAKAALAAGLIDDIMPIQDSLVAMAKEAKSFASSSKKGMRADADVDLELSAHAAELGLFGQV